MNFLSVYGIFQYSKLNFIEEALSFRMRPTLGGDNFL